MGADREKGRDLKKRVLGLLKSDDLMNSLGELLALPPRRVINPLFSFLCYDDQRVRWAAILAMGAVVKNMVSEDAEWARVIMRRLMWSLNDESGGIGWGAPEAMGEIMAGNEMLAEEFATILVSYMNEKGNYLEHPVLQRGLLWAVCRLAEVRPRLIQEAREFLAPYLRSDDATVRGLAARAAGLLGADAARSDLGRLLDDQAAVAFLLGNVIVTRSVKELAGEALWHIERPALGREC